MSLEVVPGLPGAATGTEQDFAGDGGGGAGDVRGLWRTPSTQLWSDSSQFLSHMRVDRRCFLQTQVFKANSAHQEF